MTRFAAMTVGVLLALAGCSSTGGGADEGLVSRPSGLLIEPANAVRLGYSIQWATDIAVPADQRLTAMASLGDLVVTVERPANVVTAINDKTGRMVWRKAIGGPVDRVFAPVRSDDQIIVNSERDIYQLSAADGSLINRASLESAVSNPPTMVGDIAVFGGADGMVFGHALRVGYAKWKYKMPGAVLAPAVSQATAVFVACVDGQYAAFSGQTGEILFRGRAFARVSATPVISPIGIFMASEDNSLYSLHRTTGEDRWRFIYTEPLTESPILLRNMIYQPLPGDMLLALKATDGSEAWRLKLEGKLVTHDHRGLLFNAGDQIVVRDPASGRKIDSVPLGGQVQDIIVTEDQQLILVSPRGRMMKLAPAK
jgi:outer membrane protein assembly factor BamB